LFTPVAVINELHSVFTPLTYPLSRQEPAHYTGCIAHMHTSSQECQSVGADYQADLLSLNLFLTRQQLTWVCVWHICNCKLL